jgi:hypothetical protein
VNFEFPTLYLQNNPKMFFLKNSDFKMIVYCSNFQLTQNKLLCDNILGTKC